MIIWMTTMQEGSRSGITTLVKKASQQVSKKITGVLLTKISNSEVDDGRAASIHNTLN